VDNFFASFSAKYGSVLAPPTKNKNKHTQNTHEIAHFNHLYPIKLKKKALRGTENYTKRNDIGTCFVAAKIRILGQQSRKKPSEVVAWHVNGHFFFFFIKAGFPQ
jgi:hypothetical protein